MTRKVLAALACLGLIGVGGWLIMAAYLDMVPDIFLIASVVALAAGQLGLVFLELPKYRAPKRPREW